MAGGGGGCLLRTLSAIFHYETIKIVDIENKKLGAVFRLIQFLILAYVVGYVVVYRKGYQETEQAISTVTTKLKGTAHVDFGNYSSFYHGVHVFDSSDYVIPPQEENSFFVMTQMRVTPRQEQNKCPESVEYRKNWCKRDKDCLPTMQMVKHGNGVRTGKCVTSRENSSVSVCEIYGWCPTEIDQPMKILSGDGSISTPVLKEAKNFTVLIKNQISFHKFGILRRNLAAYHNRKALRNCRYHKIKSPRCPIFRLGDILNNAGDSFEDVALKGALYGIHINWDCDFDKDPSLCIPSYAFDRLDDPDSNLSRGYNFRYSQYFVEDNTRFRMLTKAYGLRFYILVDAQGGRFDVVHLFVNLGAGLALLVVANVCCDLIVLYCSKSRSRYRHYKYEKIEDSIEDDDDSVEEEREAQHEDLLNKESDLSE